MLHKKVVNKVIVMAGNTSEPGLGGETVASDVVEDRRILTVQLGDGPRLAQQTGIDVVYDLRAADAAAWPSGRGDRRAPAASCWPSTRVPATP